MPSSRFSSNHADNPISRARFLLEAEITGGLEHPGIVPVYGMGAYTNGRPYYAMRFIRGDRPEATPSTASTPTKRMQRRPRPPARCELSQTAAPVPGRLQRDRLRPRRGVLHRDIKPANIILGKYGETLVVDWGLAKATGKADTPAGEHAIAPASASGSAETLPGCALGTPPT